MKKKKSGQSSSENKQKRIKFDVLLTSYEMINLDTAVLKPIKWECMIVDEGHRLKNKDSKLFSSLTQYSSNHRILLTGTPLQNNLDELFMLMHFLDAGKFGSLEEFQEEFKDINQEEQISRLHRMLAPHLLRRVKKDVMKDMPPKKELILRVDLSSEQKEYYKAILSRNYQVLTKKGGAQISLNNIMMELRKVCCHPYMLEGVEPVIHDANEAFKFGVGNYDWKEFVPRLKQKTYDEIKEYGVLFLKHIAEDIDENSSTFSDGVPKEGLRIEDVLVRIAVLMLVQEKMKLVEDHPGKPVFPNRILERFPGLRSGKVWKEEHDKIMIRAVLKHGYGRWQAIVDDKGLGIQELICKELNFPHISLSAAEQAGLQGQNGSGSSNLGAQNHGGGVTGNSNASPADAGQVNSMFYYRDMQRRLVEFVKKRVLLLEKALNYEYAEDYYGLGGSSSVPSEEPEAEPKVTDTVGASFIEVDDEMLQALPKTEPISKSITSCL
ncbi:hypothetical protein F2Q68_00041988 [Brassica cretica]|uniref:Helicase ATP-binding domain-containing protein n=1 Tax=Brassica cretica TaxID=69181 RepID=A0A8S9MJ64_BRACR|nr:hypothetical protein F2Q68_00041988 [Brassica cretica]